MTNFTIPPKATKAAFAQIRKIKGEEGVLRIAVDGGGCSGFQYRIEFSEIDENDFVLHEGLTKIVIDEVSMPFLAGAEIDYKIELIGSRFQIDNPNVDSACGCGTSFSIAI